ncbi:TPA: anaerobic ribonucleoside-triphosphate reductase, partial [Pasteurella multocida]|nr:anaerobic ribonucleoside-triphosphate reductase [Pasteurella multocida]
MATFFVIKRDGSRTGFEIQRIINAIKKAAQAVNIEDERYCHTMGQQVCNDIFTRYQQEIDISHIQKIVENTLMAG